jgi:hypothetical protein
MIRGPWELQDQLPELDLEPFLHREFVTGLKGTQEREFFGSDFEFCTISLLVMLKY